MAEKKKIPNQNEKTKNKAKKNGGKRFYYKNAGKKSGKQQIKTELKPEKLKPAEPAVGKASGKSRKNKSKKAAPSPIRVSFLGGLNEVGKNMTLYEYKGDMFIVDCGLAFPDPDMPGIDVVLPDFTYVEKNADKIKGVVVTHGHEDHIGGLAYLLKTVNVPIYATKLTIGLIRGKLKEHGLLKRARLNVVSPGDHIRLGCFDVELIHVNHSIPDSVALAITCEAGTVVHTGDFKIDTTPIDGVPMDLNRLAQIGSQGVLCLLSDSTNAEREGYTPSESKVGESFDLLFRRAGDRRIIVATFASNIHRVQQIINTAAMLGRKVCLSGRSLENVVSVAQELGYINVPDGLLVNIDAVNRFPENKMVIVTTGSQGEPMSALTRMAFSDHRRVEVTANDYIIISATPIPGNERTVGRVVNELMKLGAEVIYEKMYDVHVSGHACREELKMIMNIVKPKYFIPVHGEQRHLRKNKLIALSVGISPDSVIIADNGTCVEMSEAGIKTAGTVPAGAVYIDGSGTADAGSLVLRDRKHLSQDGIIIAVAVVDSQSGLIVSGPEIISRGFVYVKESEELIRQAKSVAFDSLDRKLAKNAGDITGAKNKMKDDLSRFVFEKTKKSPIILPVIMEV